MCPISSLDIKNNNFLHSHVYCMFEPTCFPLFSRKDSAQKYVKQARNIQIINKIRMGSNLTRSKINNNVRCGITKDCISFTEVI